MNEDKLISKWYYEIGTFNNGCIQSNTPVGVFKGEGSWEDGRFWIHTEHGGRKDYFDYFDSYEEACVAYRKQAWFIVSKYTKRIQEFISSPGMV